jgi:hypothetical protein
MTQLNNRLKGQSTIRFLFPQAKRWLAGIGMASMLFTHSSAVRAATNTNEHLGAEVGADDVDTSGTITPGGVGGEVVVVIASKGQFRGPLHEVGMKGLAETAHKYGFPVTWFLKPEVASEAAPLLKEWHERYGDETGWLAEPTGVPVEGEFRALQEAVDWNPIRSAGNVRYNRNWVDTVEKLGITGVWGRCFEQSYADKISDRGAGFGFYYLNPDNYKIPNTVPGGLVTVPWLSNDPNLVFRLGFQSSFTFDPNDVLAIGVVRRNHVEYWRALLDEYIRQTAFNDIVPLVVQQEYDSSGNALLRKDAECLDILDELFAHIRKRMDEGQPIRVMTMADAVAAYRQANPGITPPTYALYDNLGQTELARNPMPHPVTGRIHPLELVTERLTEANAGPPFNGYYATDFRDGKRVYYHPEGKPYWSHGKLFTYYDVNGLMMFDEGNPKPLRITSYLNIPEQLQGLTKMEHPSRAVVLPELSAWYDTAKYIPTPVIAKTETEQGFRLTIQVTYETNPIYGENRLPYGVMLWGDYSKYRIPDNAPQGTRILGEDGLFVPMVLDVGANTLEMDFSVHSEMVE